MSSISGVTSSSGLSGYGGLASGLDRDTLIEDMTYATRLKIAKQEQEKQTMLWTQNAMQGLTSSMYDFSEKYMSFTSSSNLLSSTLFAQSLITAVGSNSNYVSVKGVSSSANNMVIAGVKQLAQDAKMTTAGTSSNQLLSTGQFKADFSTSQIEKSKVEGDSIVLKYGGENYTVNISDIADLSSENGMQAIADAINKGLSEVDVPQAGGGTQKFSEVLSFSVSDSGVFSITGNGLGNSVEIVSGTGNVLTELGFVAEGETPSELTVEGSGTLSAKSAVTRADVVESEMANTFLEGKTLSFSYNGKTETITLGAYNNAGDMKDDIQAQLNQAFGANRISVGLDVDASGNASLEFKTVTPSGNDTTSHLYIAGGSSELLGGEGFFGIDAGASNRVDLNKSIAESGLKGDAVIAEPSKMIISNNGVTVDLMADYGLSWDSSVQEIIDTINDIEELNLEVSYQKETDKFLVKSTQEGASGVIDLSGDIAKQLFGDVEGQRIEGQDAIVAVQYEGMDSPVELTRSSNSFDMDGLSVSVSGTFGYTGDTIDTIDASQSVKFDAEVDTEKTTEVVKEMIDAYNKILADVNSELTTVHDRDYAPLTDDQKEDMSESEIENWEEEAMKGMLYNDSDLRSLSDELRFLIPTSMRETFEEMGITVSTDYKDKGKINFDETKFKAALEEDPEAVQDAFTVKEETNADGTTTAAGLMVRLDEIMDKYAGMTGATKGILVEKAGSIHAPTTVIENTYQNEIKMIDELIADFEDQLEMEQDRYVREFTTLETLISQMNSQSSYISSMFTY